MGDVEKKVRRLLSGVDVSPEGWRAQWEAEGDPAPPISTTDIAFFNLLDLVGIQGSILRDVVLPFAPPEIAVELERVSKLRPVKIQAAVYGPSFVASESLLFDLTWTLDAHREAMRGGCAATPCGRT